MKTPLLDRLIMPKPRLTWLERMPHRFPVKDFTNTVKA